MSFTQIATDLIGQLGYGGLGLGLILDSFGIPIPSEVLVPLGVVLSMEGRMNVWAVFAVGVLGQVLGGLAGYTIGRYGGEPILERYGKYVLISKRDLAKTHAAFSKYGVWLAMVGRCVPVVRGLIAYPAGIAAMGVGRFVVFTAIGSAVWTGFLMWLGYLMGRNIAVIDQVIGKFSLVVILALVGLLVWHFREFLFRRKEQ